MAKLRLHHEFPGCWLVWAGLWLCGFAVHARAVDVSADELASKVTIRRDTWGVPHILATTEEAVYFGQGFACAEDHCLVMARQFLKARGKEAAHFGEAFAADDFMVRRVRIWEVSKENFAHLPPSVQRNFDAYALGYNRFVSQHRADLPDWVTAATGVDVLAHGRRGIILGFSVDAGILRRFAQLGASPTPGKEKGENKAAKSAYSLRDDDAAEFAKGSNMWALGKDRSATGRALLLGNPHLPWNDFLLHEVHLSVPDKLNVMGAGSVGMPGVNLGFNDRLGWSLTVNAHDSDDLYDLTLTPDGAAYQYEGRPIPLQKEVVSIRVKTAQGIVTRTLEMLRSHYGPTLKLPNGKALAWKSANFAECRSFEQLTLMSKAKNLPEFRSALDMGALPMFNICYADTDGNCFYLFNGRFPDRPRGFNWGGIVPGGTATTEWNHMLPQARLPSLLNPPGGYVQNCNSAPWYTNLKAPIDRRTFPDELTANFNSLRQQHSLLMLNNDEKLSLEEVMKRKYTTKLLLADRVKDDVVKLARGQTVDNVNLDEAADLLAKWDNTASRDSQGSLLFTEFWQEYGKSIGIATIADVAKLYRVPWNEKRPAETPVGIGNDELARQALAAVAKAIKSKYGKLDVAWGEVYRLRRGDLDVPIGGYSDRGRGIEFGPFRVINHVAARDGKRIANGGDSYVFAVEFSSPPRAHSICAYAQSSDPKSPHYNDQSALFAREEWKRAWFTEEDIGKNLKRSYRP